METLQQQVDDYTSPSDDVPSLGSFLFSEKISEEK